MGTGLSSAPRSASRPDPVPAWPQLYLQPGPQHTLQPDGPGPCQLTPAPAASAASTAATLLPFAISP
jgi:hypothetical protein